MPYVHIRHSLTDAIIHSVVVDQPRQLFPMDLRGANLMNVDLSGASLPDANLEGAILLGCKFREADLRRANLKGADLRYTDLTQTDLTGANLEGVDSYPCNVSKRTKLLDARIDAGSELEIARKEIAEVNRWKDFRRVNP
jgi:uncharacterized protein YjbI with pentapeptide repeats